MDIFHEEAVYKRNTGVNTLIYIFLYIGMIISGIITLFFFNTIFSGQWINIIFFVVSGGITYLLFVGKNNQRIEYDYTLTNATFDVAKIINYKKRKKLLSVDINKFETIAPTSDPGFERILNHKGIEKKYNYFLNRGGGLYYGIYKEDTKTNLLVFEPSEELVKLFKRINPRAVKLSKKTL